MPTPPRTELGREGQGVGVAGSVRKRNRKKAAADPAQAEERLPDSLSSQRGSYGGVGRGATEVPPELCYKPKALTAATKVPPAGVQAALLLGAH